MGEDFIEYLKSLCELRGVSFWKMERDLGFGNGSIAKWKNYVPSVSRLTAVAEYLEVAPEALIMASKNTAPSGGDGIGISEKDQRLLTWFRSLPLEKQKAILLASDAPEGIS